MPWLIGGLIMTIASVLDPATCYAQGELLVSRDGGHWQNDLERPLFDPQARWVPGDSVTGSFWIRNTADSAGDLELRVDLTDHDQLLREGLLLQARTQGSDWVDLRSSGVARGLGDRLAAGATTRLWVRADYRADAGNRTQDELAALDFRVTLAQTVGADPNPPPGRPPPGHPSSGNPPADGTPETTVPIGDQQGPDGLAGTGLDRIGWLLPLGAVAIGAGMALWRPRRRQQGSR